VPLLSRALPRLAAGTLVFSPQDDGAATYCRKLAKEDGAIDFHFPAAVLAARINGLFPWPSCAMELNGQLVRLGLAEAMAHPAALHLSGETATEPGRVLGADADGLLVATGEGVLRLRRLQRPGGKLLRASDFLRGFPVAAGTQIPSRPMPPLVTTQR
jgi:methionyl-tRNA formyltransferase